MKGRVPIARKAREPACDRMNISEKASYIKGLLEGMNYDKSTNEGKLFAAMADLLEDISLSILDLEDETATLNDYVEELDKDLGELEEDCYGLEDDDEDEDYACGCGCEGDGCACLELECPSCGAPIYIDEDEANEIESLECPSCGKELEVKEIKEDEE